MARHTAKSHKIRKVEILVIQIIIDLSVEDDTNPEVIENLRQKIENTAKENTDNRSVQVISVKTN